jgi:PhoPQ-activated pathogenicity-related protein
VHLLNKCEMDVALCSWLLKNKNARDFSRAFFERSGSAPSY